MSENKMYLLTSGSAVNKAELLEILLFVMPKNA
jgi:hypothetical protein